ncbi:phage virion morphogenesis protein [Paradevosia shaoguanensis]|uniref:Phage virion morphogenesis protein n=1 Tax=Paradevosia shaoguanensis TaxID=1335043 RepID=A0AA41QLK4_9HYPH|nr:phage virion morphogenesis protein [Paradevosia shaoguanensis]MCF1741253.1 phage virion morphogenesis protein [Paradevosia shaoguanensis]MCI0125736.1 phage virion morphogenesis protein [Paradevosia shaoguanensis]
MPISIEISGREEALGAVREAVEHMEDSTDLFARIGAAITLSTQERFERGVAPDGNPWPKSIRALVNGGKTLFDTGYFMQSITFEASAESVLIGSDAIQAAIHQFGGTITAKSGKGLAFKGAHGDMVHVPSVTIPARPFLGLDDDDDREIIDITGEWLRNAFEVTS